MAHGTGTHQVRVPELSATTPLGQDVLRCLDVIQELIDPRAVIAGSAALAHLMHLTKAPDVVEFADVDIWVPYPMKTQSTGQALRSGRPVDLRLSEVADMFVGLNEALGGTALFEVEYRGNSKDYWTADPVCGIVDFKMRYGHRYTTRSNVDNRPYRQMQLILKKAGGKMPDRRTFAEKVIGDFDISCVRCAVANEAGDVVTTAECLDNIRKRQFRYTMGKTGYGYAARTRRSVQERRIAKYVAKGFALKRIDFGANSVAHINVSSTHGM